ncbi:MAG: peptidase MA family metallohydrolase [Planctomycetales bacterium]
MDARYSRLLWLLASLCFVAAAPAKPATCKSRNFVVTAPTPEIAQQVAKAAEVYRREIAIDWLGAELPPWYAPCPIKVKVGQIGAGGATTFTFHPVSRGPAEVCGWDMQIQGTLERILDSVLPHEISHTIFACYFRRPLPRWADEGAATLVEHESERRRQVLTVNQVLKTRRRIPLKNLLSIKEYPQDDQDIMTLYAEGYSLAELLVQTGGKAKYLKFLNDANAHGWEQAIRSNYEFQGVDDLEKHWHKWVMAGSPTLNLPEGQQLAQSNASGAKPDRSKDGGYVIRGQQPDKTQEADPFLQHTTALAEIPATSTTSGESAPPSRRLPKTQRVAAEQAPSSATVAQAHAGTDDFDPQDGWVVDAPPQTADLDPQSAGDDDLELAEWKDVAPSPARRGKSPSGSQSARERGSLASNAQTATPSRRPRDRSDAPRDSASPGKKESPRPPAEPARPRTPWSEFPSDGRPSPLRAESTDA